MKRTQMCADIHAHVDDCVIRYPAVLLLAAAAQKENKRRDAKKVVAAAATTLVFSLFGLCCSDGRALFIFPSDIPTGQHLFTFSFFFLLRKSKRNCVAAVSSLKLRELCGISTNDTASSATPPTEIVVVVVVLLSAVFDTISS